MRISYFIRISSPGFKNTHVGDKRVGTFHLTLIDSCGACIITTEQTKGKLEHYGKTVRKFERMGSGAQDVFLFFPVIYGYTVYLLLFTQYTLIVPLSFGPLNDLSFVRYYDGVKQFSANAVRGFPYNL